MSATLLLSPVEVLLRLRTFTAFVSLRRGSLTPAQAREVVETERERAIRSGVLVERVEEHVDYAAELAGVVAKAEAN